jgi:hypothetical protein
MIRGPGFLEQLSCQYEIGAVLRSDVNLEAILKLDLAVPGVGRRRALVGERAGAKDDDALHSGGEDQFRLAPLASRQCLCAAM